MNNIISRKQARSLGLTRYFTGKPCVHGHVCQRKMDGSCVDCRVIQSREMKDWNAKYNATPERIAARAAWNSTPKGKIAVAKAQKTFILSGKKAAVQRNLMTDPNYRMATILRGRLNAAIKSKRGSAVRDLGCTISEAMIYWQSLGTWNPEWTWADHGKLFEMDHVRALGLFDLSDRGQLLQAVHYMNLQPLSIEEHMVKTSVDNNLIKEHKKLAEGVELCR